MKKYAIIDAVKNTQYGPQLDFSDFYMDYIEIDAENDDQADDVALNMQGDHDKQYKKFASEQDFANAPNYRANLWDISDEYTPRKVEL